MTHSQCCLFLLVHSVCQLASNGFEKNTHSNFKNKSAYEIDIEMMILQFIRRDQYNHFSSLICHCDKMNHIILCKHRRKDVLYIYKCISDEKLYQIPNSKETEFSRIGNKHENNNSHCCVVSYTDMKICCHLNINA